MHDVVRQAAEILVGTALATSNETVRLATSEVASTLWSRIKGMFVRSGGPADFGEGEAVPLADVVAALERAYRQESEAFTNALMITASPVTGVGNAVGGSQVNTGGGDIVGQNKITR